MKRIPALIVSGFLGSGKTTLLLQLVQSARERGLRPAVLMNELGRLDVDGHLLSGDASALPLAKLLDGCICCDRKSEIAASVETLLDTEPDVLFIELTGVANPEEIADALTEPRMLRRVVLRRIVTVLDAEHVLEYNSIFASDRSLVHTLRRQIEVADSLIVNKIDLVSQQQLAKIEKAIRARNPQAPITCTTHSRIDLDALFAVLTPSAPGVRQSVAGKPGFVAQTSVRSAAPTRPRPAADGDVPAPTRSFSRLGTVSLPINEAVSKAQLEKFVRTCSPNLLRAKGYIPLPGEPRLALMQFAGKRFTWEPAPYTGEPYLVLIGLELDEAEITRKWSLEQVRKR
ncbi:GTP-binding protein [Paenibacillus athensensis]|uniref:CobW C-terminal domain-containing protein n=1 Tax=Paenibacillus athensensis TaxID=1967502 RepID=A0A4Y8Q8A6_9BACL|nr:CobW family GTP-binding protein [Paenibacillus athensensis]MCD1260368.1 GTP-binding protein [Paenibacillus athensensis]